MPREYFSFVFVRHPPLSLETPLNKGEPAGWMWGKSIFRFGELTKAREVKITEYVMTGTLSSFAVAILNTLESIENPPK